MAESNSEKLRLEIKFFASAREMCGKSSDFVTVDSDCTGASLMAAVVEQHPALSSAGSVFVLALDQQYIDVHDCSRPLPLRPNSQLAVIPPLSGG